MSRFFRLRATGLARTSEDDFTNSRFELGADGVAEDLRFVQRDLRYEPEVVETPTLDVNVYFANTPDETTVARLQGQYPLVHFEMFSEENRDWLEEWKKGFKPFRFAGPFWVVPSWLKPPPEAPSDPKKIIFVEPGMAFGTGTHETTRLAAGLLIEELGTARTLIDVGTGTGILALIAHRLGAADVTGIDIDPEARRTARENLAANGAPEIRIADDNLDQVQGSYEVVVANIIDGVLLILASDLVRVLKPGGKMILSGVLLDREREFYDEFTSKTGLRLLRKTSEGEWSAAVLEKNA